MQRFLRDIIQQAGRISLDFRARLDDLVVDQKGSRELVSEADRAVDAFLIERIRQRYPEHGLFTEESGHVPGGPFRWVIDPIDGTTAFLHEQPFYSVSIAVEKDGQTVLAAVYAPVLAELFEAQLGGGAFLNGRPIRVSSRRRLRESLLCTGFACIRASLAHNNLPYVNRLLPEIRDLHRHGSAAVDLSYVACGRLEGFWELHLNPYDVAAGMLILAEAGGRSSDFAGRREGLYEEVLSTNGLIHDEMVRILSEVKRSVAGPGPAGDSV